MRNLASVVHGCCVTSDNSAGAASTEMTQRRRNAAAAFTTRRGELDMTQEQVAAAAGVVVRTIQNFEAGRWPNPATRARLEKAVGWRPGEIARLASPAKPYVDPQLLDQIRELTDDEQNWLKDWI